MNIYLDSIVTFIIMWGSPTFMVVRVSLKMNFDDKRSAIHDFKSRHFILTIGFLVMGAFVLMFNWILPNTKEKTN